MSNAPAPVTRTFSPWWSLLLLPVALGLGWLVGQMPGPPTRPPKLAESHGATPLSAEAASRRAGAATSDGGRIPVGDPDRAPAATQPQTPEPPRGEVSDWTTLENAMAESQSDGKPVLIDFNAAWCGPCQAMRRQVFDDGARGQVVQTAVIPVSIVDRAREDGSNPPEIESLQQRYQVQAFPTLIVFSPATGRIMKTQGFGDADATLQWITEAAKAVR